MVYDDASEVISDFLPIAISAPQVQRLCNHYGGLIEEEIEENVEGAIPKLTKQTEQDPTYVMLDGSMVFTREHKWKEIKLGRLFKGSQIVDIQEGRSAIMESVYVSHLGSINEFLPKFERHLIGYRNKVIIADGAKWIWNWAEDNYPGATQILDFYHAKEKLVLYAKHQYPKDDKRKEWLEQQVKLLAENGVCEIVKRIKKTPSRNDEAKKQKANLLKYYAEHEDRMQYKTYREKGLLIGSGPIEAAHRNVIQQRLKLSGQKWSVEGACALANLRCMRLSGAWSVVERLIRNAA